MQSRALPQCALGKNTAHLAWVWRRNAMKRLNCRNDRLKAKRQPENVLNAVL
ncbi:hypothetical protein GCWU000324_01350 [Kingella oralis ATCC 51147]|uniref:Uncharacterized protein n=1 Tax=Kingella oralis ATCC 51147 TaxID=629741 RepID=C4GGT1_9NEIS|nr:hypothetical protein GCWU000324_01350 [Kingella oralis ATCC 51147]